MTDFIPSAGFSDSWDSAASMTIPAESPSPRSDEPYLALGPAAEGVPRFGNLEGRGGSGFIGRPLTSHRYHISTINPHKLI